MKISRRGPSQRSDIAPFMAMDVMSLAAEEDARRRADGDHVVHMEVGQPGGPAPRAAIDALKASLDAPLGYTVALGLPALRERIARLYGDWYGVDVDPARIVATTGSSAGFLLAFLAVFDEGDRLALGDPGYPSYRNIAKALGLDVLRVEASAADRFQPTPAGIAAAESGGRPIDGLLVASPANPTGTILDRPALTALIQACADRGAAFISDEIYHGLHYDDRAVSALEVADGIGADAIVINSFSKYFAMTGWRIGWMVVPDRLVRTIERLAQSLFICPPHASQIAALAALDAQEELEERKAVYAQNRALLMGALPSLGFDDIAPCDGAFYAYAGVSGLLDKTGFADSDALCRRLLLDAGVAATPGLDFDPVRGDRTVRFSFARTFAEISLGVDRLRRWAP